MPLAKVIVDNDMYLINTDTPIDFQEKLINHIINQYPPNTLWEYFETVEINDII
tara:strand:+ start:302 stop:463 length:162 start_codon:yes stop_codon:yes gene_type:complete